MTIPVLVVTPAPGFGEMLQQAINEQDRFQAALVQNGAEAIKATQNTPFVLSVLDSSLPDYSQNELKNILARFHPEMQFLFVFPETESPEPPGQTEAPGRPETYSGKPFYLPDLLDILENIAAHSNGKQSSIEKEEAVERDDPSNQKGNQTEDKTPSEPSWLHDVARAAQYLTRLSLESAAQAALIVRGETMWAYAGELPQLAAEELAKLVTHHWGRNGGSDLARFVRLDATGSDYILYATGLVEDYVLALVFDAATPFSQMRSQAGRLARALASPAEFESELLEIDPQHDDEPAAPQWKPLFDDVPPPTPRAEDEDAYRSDVQEYQVDEPHYEALAARPELDEVPNVWIPEEKAEQSEDDLSSLAETRPTLIHAPDQAREANPEKSTRSEFVLQPASPAFSEIHYACMLIPRMPQHHLTGNMSVKLGDWVRNLCIAFGWRLTQLAVNPNYLLWIVDAEPDISPSSLIQRMREQTSLRIFAENPDLAGENPSGDFWAPGYLVSSSSQPPPKEIMQEFIRLTRLRQGAISGTNNSATSALEI